MRGLFLAFVLLLFSLPSTAQEAGAGLTRLADAPPAPDFSLSDMDGEVFRLSACCTTQRIIVGQIGYIDVPCNLGREAGI